MNLSILILLAILEGYLEQIVYRGNYRGFGNKLFGWARINYHVPLVVKWSIICYTLGHWQFIGAFCVIQDFSWFLFHPHDELDPEDWISKPFGGVWVGSSWVPNAYVVGLTVTGLLYYLTIW